MSTGTGRSRWMRRQTSWPSIPGSMTSSTTRSGADPLAQLDAAMAVVGDLDGEALGAQARRERVGDRGLVLHDDDRRRSGAPSTRRMLGRVGGRALGMVWGLCEGRRAPVVEPASSLQPRCRAPRLPPPLDRLPPQALFVLGAISQYVGAALAVLLFATVPAAGVAWLRVVAAAGGARRLAAAVADALDRRAAAARRGVRDRARAHEPRVLPRDRPAAARHGGRDRVLRADRRRGARLAHAPRRRRARARDAGVLALADVHLAGSPGGFAFARRRGRRWAGYIVLGHRVAADAGIRPQDGLALGMAIGALALAPDLVASAVPALVDPLLLAACLAVGVAVERRALRARAGRDAAPAASPLRAAARAAAGDRGGRRRGRPRADPRARRGGRNRARRRRVARCAATRTVTMRTLHL